MKWFNGKAYVLSVFALTCLNFNSVLAVAPKLKLSEIVLPMPTEENKTAVFRTTQRLTQYHYRRFELNDDFSQKIFFRYLKSLDYSRNHFLQNEIEEMQMRFASQLDDALNKADLSIAFEMYQTMAKKRYERYQYALSLLDKEPDLTQNDQIEIDREKAEWPKTFAELDRLWTERVKNDVINLKLKGKKWPEIKKKLVNRYNTAIRRLTQTKSDDIVQIYLNAFAREIDPHTSYLAPRSAKSFKESMSLSLEGIGATLFQNEDDETVIKSLVPGAPAERSKKLKPDDKIVGVGQATGEIEDVIGWRLDDVVDKIKGKKGTKVRLEIEPAKGGKTKIVTLVRDKVRLEDQAAKLTVNTVDGKKIASIKIPGFYSGLTKDVRNLLQEAEAKQLDALIVDLRENGGGALNEAVELSGLFISDGPIVQVRDAFQQIRAHRDPDSALVYAGPLFVMIDRYSASASEIFAAAIQDYNRGIILGQNTFGKGTVQQNSDLRSSLDWNSKDLGSTQHTIQKFYRIDGGSTQLKGVSADIGFPKTIDEKEYGEEKEDNALPWDKIPAAHYFEVGQVRDFLPLLIRKHEERIAKDPEFVALNKTLKIRDERRERKYLSLNYQKRKAENEQDDARRLKDLNERFKREGKKTLKNLDDLPKDYEAPDFYLKEAEQIAVDFLQIEPQKNTVN
ncbi:carboxy terminal-processing peptidase [[Haemophilus] felis]|uniref:C-terminal processing peptidase n=1 Tax=[Haemophilus] felis TaxID=123822 RepID=A0A1T0AX23_9PAST|nr:carboxy terminal-processing peptidase [[Haemophilus] felis]NBI40472.1 carboxy terminal-processing peptidase [[Haemophilus] felis]NBI42094.1 carboxy terminal-processing peptidase [[Haemophilus] felis]OOS02109.1 C-terminal processing peptidase [[Haemophilus] felis]